MNNDKFDSNYNSFLLELMRKSYLISIVYTADYDCDIKNESESINFSLKNSQEPNYLIIFINIANE